MNTNLDEPVRLEESFVPMELMIQPPRTRSDLERLDLLMWVLWFMLGIAAGTAWLRL